MIRTDPGFCPICGAAHTSCTAGTGPITVVQVPARDAARTSADLPLGTPVTASAGRIGDIGTSGSASLGDGSDGRPFSTGTYRGQKKQKR